MFLAKAPANKVKSSQHKMNGLRSASASNINYLHFQQVNTTLLFVIVVIKYTKLLALDF